MCYPPLCYPPASPLCAPDQEGVTKAEQRTVTTGLAQGNLIEITSGLNPGELVVLEGSRKVRDGQKVKVIAPADEQ